MIAHKTYADLKKLKKIVDIPDHIKSEKVEIIILVDEDKVSPKKSKSKKVKNLAGVLKKYANPALIEKESEIAWSKALEEKNKLY